MRDRWHLSKGHTTNKVRIAITTPRVHEPFCTIGKNLTDTWWLQCELGHIGKKFYLKRGDEAERPSPIFIVADQ
jgi:hypothetical protein